MSKKPIHVDDVTVEELRDAFLDCTPIIGLKALVTHYSQHFDEILASFIFTTEGEKMFPECKKIGLGNISIKEVESHNHGLGIFWNMLKLGYLCMGFGGGPLDEHESKDNPIGYKKDCAATLMAKLLKVRDKPELTLLLNYALFTDQNGDKLVIDKDATDKEKRFGNDASKLLPASIIKNFFKSIDHDALRVEEIQAMTKTILDYVNLALRYQIARFEKRANENIKPEKIEINGKEMVVFVESDIIGADEVARQRTKDFHRTNLLTIVANPKNGRLVGLNNPQKKTNIEDYVRVIRFWANRKMNPKVKISWDDLGKAGELPQLPQLLYNAEHQNLYNGTDSSQPDVKGVYGTLITRRDIDDAIKYGLAKEFHPRYKENCVKDICDKKCPLFNMGLSQCREVRRYKGLPKKS